jgi:2-oxo-4-hydroxy-4-carboxy-5-ureidoimidazoline decarboxylase
VSVTNASLADVSMVFEHSPWVAQEAWAQGPFADLNRLHAAMVSVVRGAPRERQLALVRAHPELGARGTGTSELTADSAREQAMVGIHRLGGQELAQLRELNAAYRERFGFPLIVCVGEHTPESILAWGRARLDNSREQELGIALDEIFKIARARLERRSGAVTA